jgi:hypothetical protein
MTIAIEQVRKIIKRIEQSTNVDNKFRTFDNLELAITEKCIGIYFNGFKLGYINDMESYNMIRQAIKSRKERMLSNLLEIL